MLTGLSVGESTFTFFDHYTNNMPHPTRMSVPLISPHLSKRCDIGFVSNVAAHARGPRSHDYLFIFVSVGQIKVRPSPTNTSVVPVYIPERAFNNSTVYNSQYYRKLDRLFHEVSWKIMCDNFNPWKQGSSGSGIPTYVCTFWVWLSHWQIKSAAIHHSYTTCPALGYREVLYALVCVELLYQYTGPCSHISHPAVFGVSVSIGDGSSGTLLISERFSFLFLSSRVFPSDALRPLSS